MQHPKPTATAIATDAIPSINSNIPYAIGGYLMKQVATENITIIQQRMNGTTDVQRYVLVDDLRFQRILQLDWYQFGSSQST